jgi:hypothetical protein
MQWQGDFMSVQNDIIKELTAALGEISQVLVAVTERLFVLEARISAIENERGTGNDREH